MSNLSFAWQIFRWSSPGQQQWMWCVFCWAMLAILLLLLTLPTLTAENLWKHPFVTCWMRCLTWVEQLENQVFPSHCQGSPIDMGNHQGLMGKTLKWREGTGSAQGKFYTFESNWILVYREYSFITHCILRPLQMLESWHVSIFSIMQSLFFAIFFRLCWVSPWIDSINM